MIQFPWPKIGIIAGTFILILGLCWFIKYQHDELSNQKSSLDNSVTQMKQLRDDIVRAQSQFASKQDIENFAKNSQIDLQPIKDDLANLNAQIKGISSVLVTTPGYEGDDLSSTGSLTRLGPQNSGITIPCPSGGTVNCPYQDLFGYMTHAQILALNEPLSDKTFIPFGETQFKAWQQSPWDLKIYPRTYSVTTVLGEDENGKHYAYNKFQVETNGKTYPVKIDNSKFIEEAPNSTFKFSPRLYMGIDVGIYVHPLSQAEVLPNLEVALFSYGKTKVTPVWTFLGLGLGYAAQSKELGIVISPVNYNIAQNLPLIENLYVGPSLVFNTNGAIGILGGIRVGL